MEMKVIGKMCRELRMNKGMLQREVAADTHYSKENISAFENGRNRNTDILMWYIRNGLDLEKLREEVFANEEKA